ncbi:MAG: hypothetical protein JXM75_10895 [Chromatiaceae bacterium]|nr:hypothetical protein [Chromatiaceae bacterium]
MYSDALKLAEKAARDHAKVADRFTKLEAEAAAKAGATAMLRERHATAIRTGRKGIDPAELEAARLAERAAAEDVEILRGELEAAERALAIADRRADDALRADWDKIAAELESELTELLATRGAVAWRAALASGRSIDWRGFVLRMASEADGRQAAAPMPEGLPEVHPGALPFERREHWGRILRSEGL